MIETIIYDYLNEKLNVPAYLEAKDIDSYVLIEKTGGREENHIRSATLTIQSYAETLYEAAVLNETVIDTMLGAVELDAISHCSLNATYNFTDQTKKKHRYQSIFDLVYFGGDINGN